MILDTIAEKTRQRYATLQEKIPLEQVKEQALSLPKTSAPSFAQALKQENIAFICEAKKASPSKGVIAEEFPYVEIAKEYEQAGAAAISVLTEPYYFQGQDAYLTEISHAVSLPLLRKDFTISPYQIYEAKNMGASAILLICALLPTKTIYEYLQICEDLGLDALVETHNKDEVLSALSAGASIIGVNNRNLQTFQVDVNTSLRLRELVPSDKLFVSESGIQTPEDIAKLRQNGTNAVLIGETLMKSKDKKAALAALRGDSL